ncbi:MAG: glycosyltransferase [Myxococcales bacterium]|nr:glycosyltransferase [Myxococcales bacterium]
MSGPVDICFLSSKHPPKDKRVFDKEAVSLAKAGFRVTHLAPGEATSAFESGVELRTYAPPARLVDRLSQLPRLFRLARSVDAACYHCNEVDSWLVGVALKLSTGAKVVFDVHEIYPAEFAESRFPTRLQPVVAAGVRATIRALLPFTDRLVLAKQSAAPDYPGSESIQVLIQNFTSVEAAQSTSVPKVEKERLTAVHVGGMSRERGWPQLLEAMRSPALKDLDVLLLGGFPSGGQEEFEAAARAAGLDHRFQIVEWLPFHQAFQRIAQCDIGLLLLQPGRLNHVHAFPHKLFDYMLAELPVVVPEFSLEVSRIVSEADCGILIDPSDPKSIAASLEALISDPGRRKTLGARGRAAVLERYNWEAEAEKLVAAYTELFRDL